ncbi:PDR/VanB family oxidoreductase [Burkholderia multivorans]|uniref:PDR/VanB family oxidoreductase n=1 Tax=Burkholderia cepacia complex TaxID=87882 RepID=UPI000D009397|nr:MULTISPECIES: PDR/VanB family oxidoreductase [Burkholderia cepacia complex]MBU9205996.1 PDR/VanB family oxidoreductase [Burkholderia multivorans]MBU9451960.1 PDR/VanB family oxidoreductase [Burkholderia multivorans]MBU9486665.1 PDR/VanB family oxidoreductase [Burkholderia multivorans]MBU9492774.1 PDR/VanB family oxidoreductase [Burkholderia multivorans]MBU9522456.1 PDR/VanB family oxidoreductase [Burkholderia multivorans]
MTTTILQDAGERRANAIERPAPGKLLLDVTDKVALADGICLFEFRSPDGRPLPPFAAGAHVLIETPAGIARRYSLCNAPSERDRYAVAVKLDPASRGGSASMIRDVNIGMRVPVSAPENYFALTDEASDYLLIAGGIGITPLRAMMAELDARHARYRLVYCTRSPETSAFLDEFAALPADRALIHHDHGNPGQSLDFAALLATRHGNTHLYCCGPRPLMQAVRDGAAGWPSAAVHFEDFGTSSSPAGDSARATGFVVRLQRSGRCVNVAPGQSILDALRAAGIDTPSSCEAGTCGACRTALCDGVADHRDFVLDDDEHDSAIMICVSRAKSDELVLDL